LKVSRGGLQGAQFQPLDNVGVRSQPPKALKVEGKGLKENKMKERQPKYDLTDAYAQYTGLELTMEQLIEAEELGGTEDPEAYRRKPDIPYYNKKNHKERNAKSKGGD